MLGNLFVLLLIRPKLLFLIAVVVFLLRHPIHIPGLLQTGGHICAFHKHTDRRTHFAVAYEMKSLSQSCLLTALYKHKLL